MKKAGETRLVFSCFFVFSYWVYLFVADQTADTAAVDQAAVFGSICYGLLGCDAAQEHMIPVGI